MDSEEKIVKFSAIDYFFFATLFIVSIAIGLYYVFTSKKQKTVEEYLFGGKKLKALPVGLSLAATVVSGSTMIGQSMEIYAYGMHTWMVMVITIIAAVILQFTFVPVFYELQLLSSFSYLELRFDRSVKQVASALYVVTGIIVITLTIYVPSLAFQEVSGINIYVIAAITGVLCIWYTAIGGIRAVVWTDVFQYTLIIGSALVIAIVGLYSAGGFRNTWDALDKGGRLTFFKTDFNLETRGAIWSYLFSISLILLGQFGISQYNIQRYLSLPTFSDVKKAIWFQVILCEMILILQHIIGGVIYAAYKDCDPFLAGVVRKIDQIFPYFVMDKASVFTGFSGIFIAGIFAAGLSTTSTLLNSIAGTIYTDFLAPKSGTTPNCSFNKTIKIIVLIVGFLGIALMFVIEKLGTIFAITTQVFTLTTVSIFGVFCCGLLFPKINSKGAKAGMVISILAVASLIVGGLGKSRDPLLPLHTDGCELGNTTSLNTMKLSNLSSGNQNLPWIFRINFQYYSLIGLMVNIGVALIVSFATSGNVVDDQRLLVPFLRKKQIQETPLTTLLTS
ncbi:hypothetical protein DMENIID0001_149420 [Sergentomyia squamirostris]